MVLLYKNKQDFLGKCQTTVCFLQVSTKVESSLKSSQLSELNNRSDIGMSQIL